MTRHFGLRELMNMWLRWLGFVVWVLLLRENLRVRAYQEYQDQIPNGANVPIPCNGNFLWKGVGHFNVHGGGRRNQFGLDFAAAGRKWTQELCRKDSDNDGQTNGQELGDPQCTWRPGQIPQRTAAITHPGVCDPYDDSQCSERAIAQSMRVPYGTEGVWMKEACDNVQFKCPAKDEDHVRQIDFRLPNMPIPGKETTYMCVTLDWSDVTEDFHVIATEPILNNSNIIHHILLFGCQPGQEASERPWECGMPQCSDLVSAWGVGLMGHCFHPHAGVLTGKNGYTQFQMQLHWNNPHLHQHLTDSSGMTLYYTSQLRQYNMAMLRIGQTSIEIPPRSPHTMVSSDCTSGCTRNLMTGDIQLTSAVNHMHYLGQAMNIELHRCGRFVQNITNELVYNYDKPEFHDFHDVITVRPGDVLRTNCQFSSLHKNTSTHFGLATNDEMCFGFLSFYPKENMPYSLICNAWKTYLKCDAKSDAQCPRYKRREFRREDFNQTDMYKDITTKCPQYGLGNCTEQCKQSVRFYKTCDPCMSHEVAWDLIQLYHLTHTAQGVYFHTALYTCEDQVDLERVNRPDLFDAIACPGDESFDFQAASYVEGNGDVGDDECGVRKSR